MMKKLLILCAVVTLVGSFALSASAADWSFYGSARMKTFHEIDDKITTQTDPDDGDTTWDLQGNARLGATVKNGDIGGGFEYGTGVNLRKLFGTYTFGNNELLVGQTYSPVSNLFYSNQVWGEDNDLLGCGQAYAGRVPMIQLTFNKMVKVALVKPYNSYPAIAASDLNGDGTVNTTTESADVDAILPKLEVSFNMSKEKFFMDIIFGAQTFNIENIGASGSDDVNVTSYLVGVGGGVKLGKAYVNAAMHYALNGGNYGLVSGAQYAPLLLKNNSATYDATAVDINDNTTLAGLLVVGLKPSEKVTVEAGVGYDSQDLDVAGAKKDDTVCYYVNTTYYIADTVFVVPEIGYFDYMENNTGADQGSSLYFGAKTQINF
jgi:hypothetical protein